MKTAAFIFVLTMSHFLVFGQQAFLQDLNGRPIFENSTTDVEGSPYLRETWTSGVVKAKSNRKNYDIPKLRYDAHKDELEYDQAGSLFRFSAENVAEFTLIEGTFRAGFPAVGSLTPKNFYQVLYDGEKNKLLKRIYVGIQTEKPYNSATIIKRFVKEESLYLLKNNVEMRRFKKDKKSFFEIITDKQPEMEAFMKEQKIKFSKEDDLIRLLEKYESI